MPRKRSKNLSQKSLASTSFGSPDRGGGNGVYGKRSNSKRDQLNDSSSEFLSHDTNGNNDVEELGKEVEDILKRKYHRNRDNTVKKFLRRDYAQDKG